MMGRGVRELDMAGLQRAVRNFDGGEGRKLSQPGSDNKPCHYSIQRDVRASTVELESLAPFNTGT
jgi:hypothetical protein